MVRMGVSLLNLLITTFFSSVREQKWVELRKMTGKMTKWRERNSSKKWTEQGVGILGSVTTNDAYIWDHFPGGDLESLYGTIYEVGNRNEFGGTALLT